jgi:hypothetical protein
VFVPFFLKKTAAFVGVQGLLGGLKTGFFKNIKKKLDVFGRWW